MSSLRFGRFINTTLDNYQMAKKRTEQWMGLWNVTVYDIRIINLAWEAPDGHQVKAVPRFDSNICSTPPLMWNMPGLDPDSFLLTGIHHDSGCSYGGMFIRGVGECEFHFRRLTRLDMDNYLRMWVGAEGGNAFQRAEYYRGVRIGSAFQKFPALHYWDQDSWEDRRPTVNPHGTDGVLMLA